MSIPLLSGTRVPGITAREPIRDVWHSGIAAVDVFGCLGYGTRVAFVGEKGTGKTTVGVEMMKNALRESNSSHWHSLTSSSTSQTDEGKRNGRAPLVIYVKIGGSDASLWNVVQQLETALQESRDNAGKEDNDHKGEDEEHDDTKEKEKETEKETEKEKEGRDALRDGLPSVYVIGAPGDDSYGLQFLAPFAAMSLAEALCHYIDSTPENEVPSYHAGENGTSSKRDIHRNPPTDILVVIDDLTAHAAAADRVIPACSPHAIQRAHSEILERAAHFRIGTSRYGEGDGDGDGTHCLTEHQQERSEMRSVTAIPIVDVPLESTGEDFLSMSLSSSPSSPSSAGFGGGGSVLNDPLHVSRSVRSVVDSVVEFSSGQDFWPAVHLEVQLARGT